MSFLFKVENVFFYVQFGMIQFDVCVLKEILVNNLIVFVLLKCGIYCNVFLQCVGVDIIGKEVKCCCFLYGYLVFILIYMVLDEIVRY